MYVSAKKAIKKTKFPTWARVLVITASSLAVIIAASVLGVVIFASDYYRADDVAISAMAEGESMGSYTVFDGGGELGLVFYPGGKVEHTAYAPLMRSLADNGITCVLVDMPLNLALLNVNAWRDAVKQAPNVTKWYIGGHSLGGAMASTACSNDTFSGLILLAAYPTSEIQVPTLSIYGSLDGVLNRDKYEDGMDKITGGCNELVIEGGNHSGFGSYGAQDGDGIAHITNQKQVEITVDAILKFMK